MERARALVADSLAEARRIGMRRSNARPHSSRPRWMDDAPTRNKPVRLRADHAATGISNGNFSLVVKQAPATAETIPVG